MSEGIQITIPDFDDDGGMSAPTPFGRSGFGAFGSGGGSFGGSLDSPSGMPTPLSAFQERSIFSHSRGDSSASIDSAGSATTRYASKPGTPFSHSAQPSIATTSTAFSKKPSFASIRNAFKGKDKDAPPMPSLDHSPYPALKNPFGNRSTSSLTHVAPTISRAMTSTPTTGTYARPQTPSRNKFGKGHGQSKSQHSQNGSIHYMSDIESDFYLTSPAPPPVPRVPNGYGMMYRDDTGTIQDVEEDKVIMDPKTPSEFALHAVFIRFATSAEEKIDTFLRQPLDAEILLTTFMAAGVDPKFDETLHSLGIIAQKHAKKVIDSVMRWRRSQSENVGSNIINLHLAQISGPTRKDVPGFLNERKSLAAIHIMCRALIAILQQLSRDALGDTLGYSLEENTFDQFRKRDRKAFSVSANHAINSELYATLLGHLANVRFMSVTDRFLNELGPVAMGQVSKDASPRYENLVKGLKHIKIKVWPPEAFEEGAEFMESLSKSYANAHGNLKAAFVEVLITLLHPIGKTAQAETNNPQWGKAIEIIHPKARDMMNKRYWLIAFPLAITSLCVAPQQYFLKHWQSFFEGSISKLKEKPSRIIVMNGLLRLVWTYLYRCQEAPSTTMTKLETALKHFFPPNRLVVFPADERSEPLVYIMHFILSRHPEYGRELCLDLIQEPTINNPQKSGNIASVLSHERTLIAVNAILLSVHNTEREVLIPTWPSSSDFSIVPAKEDYPSSSAYLPQTTLKPGMQEFLNKTALALAHIAALCGNSAGHMSVFEDQWSYARFNAVYEESHNFVVRRHADGIVVAYPAQSFPHISLLQTCFQAWPRLLHPSLELSDAIDMLLRGVVHVEPTVAETASSALRRFMDDDTNAIQVVSQFNQFLFSPNRIAHETSMKLHIEYSPLLNLWVELVVEWINTIKRRGLENYPQIEQAMPKFNEVGAAALFLLSHEAPTIHSSGVRIVRSLGHLSAIVQSATDSNSLFFIVDKLLGKISDDSYLHGYDELLDKTELSRLDQWRKFSGDEIALRIADSPSDKDRKIWRFCFPTFLRDCIGSSNATVSLMREGIIAAVSRYHPSISHLAGLSSKMPASLATRNPLERDGSKLLADNKILVDQWHMWVKLLCATAVPPDSLRPAYAKFGRDHSRAPSETSFERERYMTTRGLFRHLTPFLDSEYTFFRDAAVLCISAFPAISYPLLLEDLGLLAGRQQPYDDPRSKSVITPGTDQNFGLLASRSLHDENKSKLTTSAMLSERSRRQERLHSAVARIYHLTIHLLQQQRSSARQTALSHILKFVRNTQAFLSAPEMRDNPSLHRLRRYFCGIVEQVFNELSTLKDSDRFIPSHMHLSLYRLCEEWCQVGPQSEASRKHIESMQRIVESSDRENLQRFRHETAALSHACIGALNALTPKAFFPPEQSASSPTERFATELMKPLTVLVILDRLSAIMTSSQESTQAKGMATLKALLAHNMINHELNHEALRRAMVVTDKAGSSNHRFFEVISDIVVHERHNFTFAQIVCLSLTNLRHSSPTVRCLAFNMLEAIHQQHSGLLAMSSFEASVSSLASATYVHSHRNISDFLAGEHPGQAIRMLAELGNWLPQLPGEAYDTNVILLLLQALEFWIPNINLMTEDKSVASREGLSCLYHLTSLTLRYGQSHAEQVLVLWTKLVETPQESNGHATVRFLLEQAHKVGNVMFISCASNVVASLCQTPIGPKVFEELCSVIEPIHMLPNVDHKLGFPDPQDMKLWEDLDALFTEQPRLPLGTAQFAWLLVSDVALQRNWEMTDQLPTLLHAVFTHLDHRTPFVRERARAMLFQLLRSWTPGYSELPDRSASRSRSAVKEAIASLEKEADHLYWEEDDPSEKAVPMMKQLATRVLVFLEPLAPHLLSQWGSLALAWGTSCSIRATAFRSLQIFRALMPRVKTADFALLIGRLSNTVATAEENIQSFTSEIFLTIDAVANAGDLDKALLPQVFWCACACLSTTVEQEFVQTIVLLESLLTRIDLDDPITIDQLLSHRPATWMDSPFLQPPLLRGLRSSVASGPAMKALQILAKIKDGRLIDASEGRLRDLYTVALPWCLHAMDQAENPLKGFAEDIGTLAAQEQRYSIQKIMNSFARGHFRTRDDFLRQSVGSLREHYGAHHWTEIVTLLFGLVLNAERWLRIQAMQVLKVLFQHRETRNPVEILGSELLMPLLRLLETDLAPQALDVLEEPMAMSLGGPAAKHVLRMSMHAGSFPPPTQDSDSVTTIFGVPTESGWCVAQADKIREICQANVMAVFDTCSVPTRPSRIEFEPEVEALQSIKTPLADDLNVLNSMVQNLTELTNSFFDDETMHRSRPRGSSVPTRRLEARVAAILAKSSAPDSVADTPQTPFLDVFNVERIDQNQDSDEDSDSDSDTDAFVFDTLYSYPSAPNGARYD